MGTPDTRAAFEAGLQKAGLSIDTLRTIVLSHDHPDHIGLSGELHEQSGAAVYMHPMDAENMRLIWHGIYPERFVNATQFFRQHGMPKNEPWCSQANPDQRQNILRV